MPAQPCADDWRSFARGGGECGEGQAAVVVEDGDGGLIRVQHGERAAGAVVLDAPCECAQILAAVNDRQGEQAGCDAITWSEDRACIDEYAGDDS